jgi:hypothetical protein
MQYSKGGKDVQNGSTSTLQGFDEFPVNAGFSSFSGRALAAAAGRRLERRGWGGKP